MPYLMQVRDEGAAALLAQRQQLEAAHDADRALLLREVSELTSRMGALRQLAARDSEEAEARLQVQNWWLWVGLFNSVLLCSRARREGRLWSKALLAGCDCS